MSDADRLDQLDYYGLLGVSQEASGDDLQRAFHAFALKYHPDRFAAAGPDAREEALTVYRRGAEAYKVLSNPEKRRAYDAGLPEGRTRFDPSSVARKTTVTKDAAVPARARAFAAKADLAIKAGDLQTAKLNLKIALTNCGGSHPGLEAKLAQVEAQLKAGA